MDLTTLPNECFVIILRHLRTHELVRLRKQNYQISLLSKAYTIMIRVTVKRLSLGQSMNGYIRKHWHFVIEPFNSPLLSFGERRPFHLLFDQKIFLEILDKYLKKIEVTGSLNLENLNTFDDIPLDVLEKNRKSLRDVTNLVIPSGETSLPKLRNLFDMLPQLEYFTMNDAANIDELCAAKLFHRRKWRSLKFNNTKSRIYSFGLNDNFLFEVVRNCNEFIVDNYDTIFTRFTVPAIIKLFKECFVGDEYRVWKFSFVGTDITLAEAERQFRAVPGFEIEFKKIVKRKYQLTECRVYRAMDTINGLKSLSFCIFEGMEYVNEQ